MKHTNSNNIFQSKGLETNIWAHFGKYTFTINYYQCYSFVGESTLSELKISTKIIHVLFAKSKLFGSKNDWFVASLGNNNSLNDKNM